MSQNTGLDAVRAFGEGRAAFWADPPRGACAVDGCPEDNPILYGEPSVCAGHYRATQASRDEPYPCDECGQGPAFRDPLHRDDVYLCPSHHERNGYVPGERALVSQIEKREGFTHSQGRKPVCTVKSDSCRGQVKPRGKLGTLCDFHAAPKKYLERKGS